MTPGGGAVVPDVSSESSSPEPSSPARNNPAPASSTTRMRALLGRQSPTRRLSRGADDQNGAGRVVGHLVRHGAEQEALRARHALVAHDDEAGVALLRDVEDGVGGI